jgi:hypothetical protein
MLRALKREKRPYRAWLAGHPDRQAIFERLEWKAWSTLLWGLDAGDPKVIRFYLDTFRRMPDGSVRARPLPRIEPPRVRPIRPPTVKKLIAQDRRRAVEAARVLAAEAIVADIHARGAETYAALAAVLPAWRQPPRRQRRHLATDAPRTHRPYRSYGPPPGSGAPQPVEHQHGHQVGQQHQAEEQRPGHRQRPRRRVADGGPGRRSLSGFERRWRHLRGGAGGPGCGAGAGIRLLDQGSAADGGMAEEMWNPDLGDAVHGGLLDSGTRRVGRSGV